MLDLRIIADGQPLSPLELVMRLGPAAAAQEIGAQIEVLIATLDRLDGDVDLEDDDPAGDPLDVGEHPADDGYEILPEKPIYGPDQRELPINGRSAWHAHLDRQRGD